MKHPFISTNIIYINGNSSSILLSTVSKNVISRNNTKRWNSRRCANSLRKYSVYNITNGTKSIESPCSLSSWNMFYHSKTLVLNVVSSPKASCNISAVFIQYLLYVIRSIAFDILEIHQNKNYLASKQTRVSNTKQEFYITKQKYRHIHIYCC